MQKKYLYLVFTTLLGCVALIIALLFKYVQPDLALENVEDRSYLKSSEIASFLEKESYKDSWVYKMHQQKKINPFSYSQTIYQLKLN